MFRGKTLHDRDARTNRPDRPAKCDNCKQPMHDAKAKKSGLSPPENWVLRCACGVRYYVGDAK